MQVGRSVAGMSAPRLPWPVTSTSGGTRDGLRTVPVREAVARPVGVSGSRLVTVPALQVASTSARVTSRAASTVWSVCCAIAAGGNVLP